MPLLHLRILLLILLAAGGAFAQPVGQPIAVWREGQLDIHHISTGQGNATFAMLPDGIDAGAINPLDWRTGKPRSLQSGGVGLL